VQKGISASHPKADILSLRRLQQLKRCRCCRAPVRSIFRRAAAHAAAACARGPAGRVRMRMMDWIRVTHGSEHARRYAIRWPLDTVAPGRRVFVVRSPRETRLEALRRVRKTPEPLRGPGVVLNYLFTLSTFSEARRVALNANGSSRRARPDPTHPPLRIDASNSPAPDFCAGSRDNRGRNASESA